MRLHVVRKSPRRDLHRKHMLPPLKGLLVLDFSTLLPGPLASLVLAEAGARVIKIERPGRGDEMRGFEPMLGDESANFHLLNRGKESIALDLKAPGAIDALRPLLARADVLIEQFRPGVMQRLGLGYEALHELNPRLVYCSITGYGQTGPKAQVAAHDLNYLAESGLLGLSSGADGSPVMPPILAADVSGGTLPAVINILLALRVAAESGCGTYLDIGISDHLYTLGYWAWSQGLSGAGWPRAGDELATGGSPRYQIYRTADDRYLAAAPLEDKFWDNFSRLIDLPVEYRQGLASSTAVIAAVRARIATKTAEQWRVIFGDADVCCSLVATFEEAMQSPQLAARNTFAHKLVMAGREMPALPPPLAPAFRPSASTGSAPSLGSAGDPSQLSLHL